MSDQKPERPVNVPDYLVLVIDDDVRMTFALSVALERTFRVESVHTAHDALKRLAAAELPRVHAVVLDLRLENGVGLALVKRFQKAAPQVAMVVLTGYDFKRTEMIAAGAQDFLKKPVEAAVLVSTVAEAIIRHQVRGTFTPIEHEVQQIKNGIEEAGLCSTK